MRCAGTLLVLFAGLLSTTALGQGYYRSYGGYSYSRPYQNNYHGYWRDQGYGFTNRPIYGGYRYSESYWGGPAFGPGYQYGGYPRYYRW
jgi:hypothetical protein